MDYISILLKVFSLTSHRDRSAYRSSAIALAAPTGSEMLMNDILRSSFHFLKEYREMFDMGKAGNKWLKLLEIGAVSLNEGGHS